MDLRGVHHVSINVSDLDETVAFYTDTLGLAVLERPDGKISVPGVWLGCPDGREIHLLLNDVPDRKGQHFAFEVGDVDAAVAVLAGAGHQVSQPSGIEGICRQVFCNDPSGNLVELNQRLR
jgi:catechol 2,3-dioxygenase-like lactoylglutathione lyase family enzyme